jgi:phage gp36-like protein
VDYITPAQLIERFSPEELAQRAAPEGTRVSGELFVLTVSGGDRSAYSEDEISAADQALNRVSKVVEDACALIDGYVETRLTMPLPEVPRLLLQIAGDVFRYLIYDDQLDVESIIERRYRNAIKLLEQIRDGKLSVGAPIEDETGGNADSAEVRTPGRIFSRETLKDF